LITHYLFNSDQLKLINLLIDSRRGIKQHDIDVMDMIIENEVNLQIICTKSDEIKNHAELELEIQSFIKDRYKLDIKPIFTSVKKKRGLPELQKSILSAL
jgi:GTP-binding protein